MPTRQLTRRTPTNHSMTVEAAEEYTASLGQIGAGMFRQVEWATEQGVPAALGLSTEEWVTERLGGYMRLDAERRREAILELRDNGWSNRKIAEILGISHQTVMRVLAGPSGPEELEEVSGDTADSELDGPDGPEEEEDWEDGEYASHDDELAADTTDLDAEVEEDPDVKAAAFYKNLTKDMKVLGKILTYSPDRAAEVVLRVPELRDTMESILPDWKRWIAEMEEAITQKKQVRRIK
jgi:transposase